MTPQEFKDHVKQLNTVIIDDIMAKKYEIKEFGKYTVTIHLSQYDIHLTLWVGNSYEYLCFYDGAGYSSLTKLFKFSEKQKKILHKRFNSMVKESYNKKRKAELLKELEELEK